MSSSRGRFVWYELMTNDVKAAEAFYKHVVGWHARDAGMEQPYTLFSRGESQGDKDVGGLMAIPPEAKTAGARPMWTGYIRVDDVDGDARRIQESGGKSFVPPTDIPGVGRFTVLSDPQGATFALFKPLRDEEPVRPDMGTPGMVGWHELYAADLEAAIAFYTSTFGWTKDEAIDMGPLGKYQTFKTTPDQAGGMMTTPKERPMPTWGFYFNVEDVDAAIGRVREGGGQVLNGPEQVPGGTWIANCLDPQGAAFSIAGSRKG
jgi:uncharacterized protein